MQKEPSQLSVLQILPKLEMGGVERGTLDLAIYLKEKGHASYIASSGGVLTSSLKRKNIPHFTLPLHSKNPITILLNAYRLKKIIQRYNINIIDVRSRAPAWSAFLACPKNVCLITTFHGAYGTQSILKKIYNSVMLKGRYVIAVSQFIAQHIQKTYRIKHDHIITIPRGVDLSIFSPEKVTQSRLISLSNTLEIPEDKSILLIPGRLSAIKGHLFFIKTLELLKRNDFICLFVGKGKKSYKKRILQLAEQLGLAEKIYLKESCPDIAALYKLASVTINPSIWPESFGRTLIEAGAMGCPTIASDHGGASEIIQEGETGFLFPVLDREKLAERLNQVLDFSSKDRAFFKKKSIEHVAKNYCNEKMLSKTLDAYKMAHNQINEENSCH